MIEWLSQRPLSFYIKLFITVFITAVILSFVFTYSVVFLTVSGSNSKTLVEIYNSDKQLVKKVNAQPSKSQFIIIQKGLYEARASENYNQTLKSFKVDLFKKNDLPIKLKAERSASKISSESMGCGMSFDTTYFSYSCNSPSSVFQHSQLSPTSFSEKTSFTKDVKFDQIKPYQNGLLLVSYGDRTYSFQAINPPNPNITTISNPNIDLKSPQILTGVGDFTLGLYDTQTKKVALYRSPTDPKPVLINFDNEPEISDTELIMSEPQIADNAVYVYFYPKLRQGDVGVENDEAISDKSAPGYLMVYSLKNMEVSKKLLVPASTQASTLHKVGDSFLAEASNNSILKLSEKGNSLEKTGEFTEASNVLVVKELAYFNKSNAIYQYNAREDTAYRLFHSEKTNISSISESGGDIYFTAYSQNKKYSSLPDGFKLNLNQEATYPRAESTLPYANSDLVKKMDYNDSLILVSPTLTSLGWDRQTGKPFFNQDEFNTKKNDIISLLKRDGLDEKRAIYFTY